MYNSVCSSLFLRFCGYGVAMIGLLPAQELLAQFPAQSQQGTIALVGGMIHPVTSEAIENGTIVFEGGVIKAIGSDVEVPANSKVIDMTGKHIYPGLIDAFTNLGLFENSRIAEATDTNEEGTFNPNVRAEVAFHPASRHIGVARSAGVLVSVSSPAGGLVSGYASAMNLDGWTWEQMSLKGRAALIVNWPATSNESNYNQSIKRLRELFADARAYQTAQQAAADNEAIHHDTDARWESMQLVLDREVPVIVSAGELRQMQDVIRFAEQENLRLVLRGGANAGMIAEQLAEKNIPLILTSVLDSPSLGWQPYDEVYSLPSKLHQAGVRFAITGGSTAQYVNRTPFEAGAAVAFGLPEDVAIKSLTIHPAEFLGIDDRVGSLQVGKDATLLITTGSPVEYSTEIEQAFIQGREIDMLDLHKEFFQRYMLRLEPK